MSYLLTLDEIWSVHLAPYREGPRSRKIENTEIDKMLRRVLLNLLWLNGSLPSCSIQWRRIPTLLADDMKINAITVDDSCPIPRQDEGINSLGHALAFFTLDYNCSNWQVEMDDANRDKTASTLRHGQLWLSKRTFRLCNSPDTFQRTMHVILLEITWEFALVSLSDIITFSELQTTIYGLFVLYCRCYTELASQWP